MAVVGDAYVVVRAITNRVKPDIENAFRGLDRIGEREGEKISDSFGRGLNSGDRGSIFERKWARSAEQVAKKFNRLVDIGYVLGPVISGVVGAIGALGAGLVGLSTILSRATPAAIALAGSLAALAQGALTGVLAFSGIGNAISAGLKQPAAGAAKSTRALENALKRLKDLQDQLAETFDKNAFILPRYEEAARARRDAEDALADALISNERSQRAYERAQKESLDAQEDVTRAREEAKEALQQLRFELEGGAISEKKARLEFEKARESLQRVQDLPPNSRARQEAELAFAEAELNLRKAIDRNADLKKEESAATKAGVEGSSRVQAALEAATRAREDENDAKIDAARSVRDLAKQREETARIVEENSEANVLKEIQEERAKLRDQIKETKKDIEDLKRSAGGPANAYQQALEKLSPAAQRFVKFIIDNKKAFQDLKFAAQEGLFPGLQEALETLINKLFPVLEPLLYGTGKALGEVAIEIADVITEATNLEQLQRIWETNDKLIGNFGGAIANLIDLFLTLLDAGRPVIEEFGQWIEDLTGGWATSAAGNFETIQGRMEGAATIVKRLAGIFGSLFDAFGSIGEAVVAGGGMNILLEYFEDAASGFADLMASMNEDGSLGVYFRDAITNATKVLDLLGNIVAEIFKLGDDKGVGSFVDSLSAAVDTFGRIGENVNEALPTIGLFIEKFALLTEKLTESGAIEAFFKVLNAALDIANTIFGNKTVASLFGTLAAVFGLTRGFRRVLQVAKFVGKGLIGNFVGVGKGIAKGFAVIKDPFGGLRKGSGLTRAELKKQMVVDKQKKMAMKGIFMSGKQAGAGIGKLTSASKAARGVAGGTTKQIGLMGKATGAFGKVGGVAGRAATGLGKGFRAVGSGLKAALGPVGLIFLAIELLIPLIVKLWQENETFRNVVMNVVNAVKNAFQAVMDKVMAVWEFVQPIFQQIGQAIGSFIGAAIDVLLTAWDAVSSAVQAVWNFVQPIFEFIGNAIATYITFYVEALKIAWDLISTTVQAVWDFLKPIFQFIGDAVKKSITFYVEALKTAWDAIKGAVQTVWNFVKPIFTKIGDGIKNSITFYVDAFKTAWNGIKSAVQTVWNFVKPIFEKIGNKIQDAIGGAVSVVTGLIDGIKNVWDRIISGIKSAWNSGPGGFGFDVPDWVPVVGGKTFRIPTLAQGGIIPASSAGTLAILAEAGRSERVEPLDPDGLSKRDKAMIDYLSGGGSGATINVYPSAGMNERELAMKVSRELVSMMRKGAA